MNNIQISDWSMLLITGIYVFITYRILRAANLNTKETLRPRVYGDFNFDFQNQTMYVQIKNFGKKAAYNIQTKFDPDFIYGNDESLNAAPYIKSLPFLAPGNERKSILGKAPELFKKQKNDNIKISIEYTGKDPKEKFSENYNFSLDSFRIRFKTN